MKERIKKLLTDKVLRVTNNNDLSLNKKKEILENIFKEIDKKINDGYVKLSTGYGYGYGKTHKISDALKNGNDFNEIIDYMSNAIFNDAVDKLLGDII